MTNIPSPVTAARMGRPPLNVRETKVRLPDGMVERIDALVGPNKRAQFIREATEEKLDRHERAARKPKPSIQE
ncbi:ribbon-helix-helix domain-containing protein [Beijerinckia sp. L45]|uniref:ribbon-helix-helix domain-containing protein n=1 Tax=Beijerinckia sp. L45 TaxID=1641855 RepID=UPI001FEFE562|nr:ribbon-helix-helix domain-containing protein [Beijerinckia sp. L45]